MDLLIILIKKHSPYQVEQRKFNRAYAANVFEWVTGETGMEKKLETCNSYKLYPMI